MELSRQEYWNMLPFPSPGDLPDPGIKPRSPALQGDSLFSGSPGEHNAREITLNVLNCPRDERSGSLYQSCFKAAAWIHSSWLKATSRLIAVMRTTADRSGFQAWSLLEEQLLQAGVGVAAEGDTARIPATGEGSGWGGGASAGSDRWLHPEQPFPVFPGQRPSPQSILPSNYNWKKKKLFLCPQGR